jgi:hypothetical protein
MLTPGSPASIRISVGTEVPMRKAQTASDSLRRKRATAKSAPNCCKADKVAGGI